MPLGRRTALRLLAAASLAPARRAHAAPLKKVRMLIPSKSMNEGYTPWVVPKYLGWYEAEGLDVDLIFTGGSNEVAISVSAGAGDVGAASPAQALIGMQSFPPQLDVKYFYNAVYRSIWTLSVLPDSPIKTIKDLKGKRLGVLSMGSAGVTFGKALAIENGLDPDKDISFLPIGLGAQAITAVNRKLVDALAYSSQDVAKFQANGLDIRYLDVGEGFASLPDVGILARQEWVENEVPALTAFARCVAKGYLFSVTNPEAAVKINWKLYPDSAPQNQSPEQALKGGMMVCEGRMNIWSSPKTKGVLGLFIDSDWQRVVDYMKTQGFLKENVPLSRIYTNSMIPGANQFDKAAIIQQAKDYKI